MYSSKLTFASHFVDKSCMLDLIYSVLLVTKLWKFLVLFLEVSYKALFIFNIFFESLVRHKRLFDETFVLDSGKLFKFLLLV